MHDNTWRAYGGPGRKNGSGDGGVRSYQVQAKCRVKRGMHVRGDMGGAWRCMGQIQLDPRGTHCTRCGRDGSPCPSGNAWRAHQWGSWVAHVTGACDHIRFKARGRERMLGETWGVHGDAWGLFTGTYALHSVWMTLPSTPT